MSLMESTDWDLIESSGHFKRAEFKDDPYKIEKDLVNKIRNMRIEAGKPFHIHCAWADGTGHAPNSRHYMGEAVDLDIVGMTLINQVKLAYKHGFTGIGAYPGWSTPGIHVDVRHTRPTYWIEPANKKGTGEYVYFSNVDEMITTLGQMEA